MCCGTRESADTCRRGSLRPAIANADLDQDVLGCVLGVLHEHVKVAVAVEDTGVQQFVFHLATIAELDLSGPGQSYGKAA